MQASQNQVDGTSDMHLCNGKNALFIVLIKVLRYQTVLRYQLDFEIAPAQVHTVIKGLQLYSHFCNKNRNQLEIAVSPKFRGERICKTGEED